MVVKWILGCSSLVLLLIFWWVVVLAEVRGGKDKIREEKILENEINRITEAKNSDSDPLEGSSPREFTERWVIDIVNTWVGDTSDYKAVLASDAVTIREEADEWVCRAKAGGGDGASIKLSGIAARLAELKLQPPVEPEDTATDYAGDPYDGAPVIGSAAIEDDWLVLVNCAVGEVKTVELNQEGVTNPGNISGGDDFPLASALPVTLELLFNDQRRSPSDEFNPLYGSGQNPLQRAKDLVLAVHEDPVLLLRTMSINYAEPPEELRDLWFDNDGSTDGDTSKPQAISLKMELDWYGRNEPHADLRAEAEIVRSKYESMESSAITDCLESGVNVNVSSMELIRVIENSVTEGCQAARKALKVVDEAVNSSGGEASVDEASETLASSTTVSSE